MILRNVAISRLLFIPIGLGFFTQSHAQFNLYQRSLLEVKASYGGSFFLGDLGGGKSSGTGGFKDLDLRSAEPMKSIGLKINLSNIISLRGDLIFTKLSGDDALSGDPRRAERNLSFRTNLTEFSVTIEGVSYNLANFGRKSTNTSELYGFIGFGWIRFNPQAKLNNIWYDLQPLGTEGQGLIDGLDFYNLNSVVVPFGIGYRKNIGKRTYLGLELSMRKTFTDYIDDTSGKYADENLLRESRGDVAAELSNRSLSAKNFTGTNRGDKSTNDNYSFIQFTVMQGFGKRSAAQKMKIFMKKGSKGRVKKCPDFN